jgi:hypothetical protein
VTEKTRRKNKSIYLSNQGYSCVCRSVSIYSAKLEEKSAFLKIVWNGKHFYPMLGCNFPAQKGAKRLFFFMIIVISNSC